MMRIAALLCVGSITVGCAETADLSLDGRDGIDGEARDGASDDGSEAADADAPDGGCPPGRTPCSGACVDVTSDPANCGSCGRRCDAGEVCNEGLCASTCTGGLRNCSGACVDVNANRLHCGDCDRPCAANEDCRSGTCVCVPACTSRTCGPDGCGGTCPPGCGTGFTCSATGTCTCSGTVCGSACCSAGQVCNAGACCTPNCAGRTCGPDGCGGSCPPGCGTGLTCSATGTCTCSGTVCGAACCPAGDACISGACCDERWTYSFTATKVVDLALDPDGTIYAAGIQSGQVYVIALDACGARLRDAAFALPSTTATAGAHLTAAGSDLYVVSQFTEAGTDPGDGMWARLDKASLARTWVQRLDGDPAYSDDVYRIAVADDGNIWMAGVMGSGAATTRAWGLKGTSAGSVCGWDVFPGTAARALANLSAGGRIWLTGVRGVETFLTSYAPSECSAGGPACAACTPSGPTVAWLPTGMTEAQGRALARLGATTWVVGWVTEATGDSGGMIVGVTGSTYGAPLVWDPTANPDGFMGVAASAAGTELYLAGFTNGIDTGLVARYVPSSPTLAWTATPAGAGRCRDVVVDAAGGIVLLCGGPGNNDTIRRCLGTGACP